MGFVFDEASFLLGVFEIHTCCCLDSIVLITVSVHCVNIP